MFFNNLKEDFELSNAKSNQIRIRSKKALFKNSFKTINALEYVYTHHQNQMIEKVAISKEILSFNYLKS